jgi:protein O-mannosyl-transferase
VANLSRDYHVRMKSRPPYCRNIIFPVIVLSIIVFITYGNSFDCSWHFDDIPNITDNPDLHLTKLAWKNLIHAFFSDQRNADVLYRPVACLSFALNYYFDGLDVVGYHLVNIFIHLFTSIFLFFFIYNTLNLPSLKEKYASQSYSIAILATILWAINPVQTQAVTYIVQRMASLSGMFYILSMYLYMRARTTDSTSTGQKVLFFISCFISFVLAFGSKENAVMLPVSLFLYEALIIQDHTGRFMRRNMKGFLIVLGATLLMGLAYLYYKGENLSSFIGGGYGNRPFSLGQRLLSEPRIIIFYVSLLIYPVPNRLSIAHSIQISTSLFDPIQTLLSIIFVFGAIAYLIFLARKHPLFSFCYLFFFLNHLIESTVFPLELIFEHRNYIPSMLFFVPVGIGFCHLLERYRKNKSMQFIFAAFVVLLLVGLGHSTFMRNFTWKNPISLWTDASEKAPDQFRVHHNLGSYYQNHGYNDKAVVEYQKALTSPFIYRKSEVVKTYCNLGSLYEGLKDYGRAEFFYKKALQLKPNFSHTLNGLASIYDKAGKSDIADQYIHKAFKANPGDARANLNMGLYFLKNKLPDKALNYLLAVKDSKVLGKDVLFYLGIAYKQTGLYGRAVTYFREAKIIDPKNVTPTLYLAEIYHKTGNCRMARKEMNNIVDLMMEYENIFSQIMDLISRKGGPDHIELSPKIILSLLSKACNDKSKRLIELREDLEKLY